MKNYMLFILSRANMLHFDSNTHYTILLRKSNCKEDRKLAIMSNKL